MKSSDHDFKTMNHLLKSKDYSWALFVGHLVIEKMLKAYYATKLGGYPPHTHNLLKLAENSGLEISLDRKKQLDTITSFNLSTRYDNEKLEFYKKCTRPFALLHISGIKLIRKWIKEELFLLLGDM